MEGDRICLGFILLEGIQQPLHRGLGLFLLVWDSLVTLPGAWEGDILTPLPITGTLTRFSRRRDSVPKASGWARSHPRAACCELTKGSCGLRSAEGTMPLQAPVCFACH